LKLTTTSDARGWAAKKYVAHYKRWLAGDVSGFPLTLVLCELTESEFMTAQAPVRLFYGEWKSWPGPGQLNEDTWRWARAGTHALPSRLTLSSPEEVAELAGKLDEWNRMSQRQQTLQVVTATPAARFAPLCELLKNFSVDDWACFCACMAYFVTHAGCDLYVRQLPIEGVDTKWVGQHQAELTKALALVLDRQGDFYELTGVRRPDHLNHVVVRVLCPVLRQQLAGLGTLDVPVSAVAAWELRPEKVLFVENLESGLALGDIPGTLAFVGKGNAATSLAEIPWVSRTRTYYWGDLDTHGLAIFARMRARLPNLVPILMDVQTLTENQPLWVKEKASHAPVDGLPAEQQVLFEALTRESSLQGIRLEQERLPWDFAWAQLQQALSAPH
jgi:hypothetical protein